MRRLFLLLLFLSSELAAQMAVNGRIESWFIDGQNGEPAPNSLNVANNGKPTFGWRFRAYLDLQVSERSVIFSDLRLQPNGLYVDFAAIRVYLTESRNLRLQTGLLGTFIGNVAERRSSKYNPMLQLPLPYFYLTNLTDDPYQTQADLLENRGLGTGLRVFELAVYRPGAELLWVLWDKIDVQAGLYNSPPSNPYLTNNVDRLNVSARLGFRPMMGLNFGLSYSGGPFMSTYENTRVDVSREDQTLYDIDLSFERGHFSFFSEATWSAWTLPHVEETLVATGYYAEAKYKFLPHFYLAARFAQMFFSDIDTAEGKTSWDDNTSRLEASLGYYIERETLAKIVYQMNDTERVNPSNDAIAIELSAGF